MQHYSFLLLILASINAPSCTNGIPIDNIEEPPELLPEDEAFANVFKALDGIWEGEFIIYEDTQQAAKQGLDLEDLNLTSINKPSLKEINRIQVRQEYTSESPYFQRVRIRDFYPDSGKEEISIGVNKVQNGKMWCVVHKPEETVIHNGSREGTNTIIWQRNEKKPQRVEFFKETVGAEYYEIIGWGYYAGDDLSLTPRLWFYSKYERKD